MARPMKNVTGGGLPARIWHDFMTEAHAFMPVRPLLADASIYANAATLQSAEEEAEAIVASAEKPKKKRGFLSRLFGGS